MGGSARHPENTALSRRVRRVNIHPRFPTASPFWCELRVGAYFSHYRASSPPSTNYWLGSARPFQRRQKPLMANHHPSPTMMQMQQQHQQQGQPPPPQHQGPVAHPPNAHQGQYTTSSAIAQMNESVWLAIGRPPHQTLKLTIINMRCRESVGNFTRPGRSSCSLRASPRGQSFVDSRDECFWHASERQRGL